MYNDEKKFLLGDGRKSLIFITELLRCKEWKQKHVDDLICNLCEKLWENLM